MDMEYTKPELEFVGKLEEVTAAHGVPVFVDVPFGTIPTPGQQIIGSR